MNKKLVFEGCKLVSCFLQQVPEFLRVKLRSLDLHIVSRSTSLFSPDICNKSYQYQQKIASMLSFSDAQHLAGLSENPLAFRVTLTASVHAMVTIIFDTKTAFHPQMICTVKRLGTCRETERGPRDRQKGRQTGRGGRRAGVYVCEAFFLPLHLAHKLQCWQGEGGGTCRVGTEEGRPLRLRMFLYKQNKTKKNWSLQGGALFLKPHTQSNQRRQSKFPATASRSK